MKLYRVTYRDDCDPGCPSFTWACRAHNSEHAVMKFQESLDAEGWEIVKVEAVKEGGRR